jgi:hypothetical protein
MASKKRGSRSSPKKKKTAKTKAKAKPKTKAKAKPKTKAKAKPKTKAKAKPAKKPKPKTNTKPQILDEVIEEPLLDASAILRVKDAAARSQRDVDEDERKQFSDPSLVVEAQTKGRDDGDDADEYSRLPDLFAAEARRQKAARTDATPSTRPGASLFDEDPGSDEPDED